jgi:hypothetical protein
MICSICTNYKNYIINDKKKIVMISKYIKYSAFVDEEKNPSGFIIGDNFVGFLKVTKSNHYYEKELSLFINEKYFTTFLNPSFSQNEITKSIFDSITDDEYVNNVKEDNVKEDNVKQDKEVNQDKENNNPTALVEYWYRSGSYWDITYKKRFLCINIIPNKKQREVCKRIIESYEINGKCTSFISGQPGSGKSSLLRILGVHFKSCICKQLRITDPNDSIEVLYNYVEPTKKKPLIILFDEIDTMIDKVHNNKISPHKQMPIEVFDKTSYNTFFDDINDNMYPYVILLLTSNKTKEIIDTEFEGCYLREGRVDEYFEI